MSKFDTHIRYVVDTDGDRTDVLVPMEIWERILSALRQVERSADIEASEQTATIRQEIDPAVRSLIVQEDDQASVDALFADLKLMVEQGAED